MRYLRVDFLPSRYWILVWTAGLLAMTALSVLWINRVIFRFNDLARTEEALTHTKQMTGDSLPVAHSRPGPVVETLSTQLKLNLGPLLNAAEAPLPSGAKLVGLTFASNPGTVRLEYQLAGPSQVRLVADALNGGYNVSPWKLSHVTGVAALVQNSTSANAAVVRAAWEASLSAL
jgi:hypothetical protein